MKETSKILEQHRRRTWYIFVYSPFFLYLLCALAPGYRFNRSLFLSTIQILASPRVTIIRVYSLFPVQFTHHFISSILCDYRLKFPFCRLFLSLASPLATKANQSWFAKDIFINWTKFDQKPSIGVVRIECVRPIFTLIKTINTLVDQVIMTLIYRHLKALKSLSSKRKWKNESSRKRAQSGKSMTMKLLLLWFLWRVKQVNIHVVSFLVFSSFSHLSIIAQSTSTTDNTTITKIISFRRSWSLFKHNQWWIFSL